MYQSYLINESNDVTLKYKNPLREESHPELASDFPYKRITRIYDKTETGAPWHWHSELEIFYIEKGVLEYRTPDKVFQFSEGCGGLINSNILHRTKRCDRLSPVIQKIHIFSPAFIAAKGTLIYKKYLSPLIHSKKAVFIFDAAQNTATLQSFQLASNKAGYEIRLQSLLSGVLLGCYEMLPADMPSKAISTTDEKLLGMVAFIEEHLNEKISVKEIAATVYVSERDCYRKFQKELGKTPLQFIQNIRLERACQLLSSTDIPVTDVASLCGLGSSSYFCSVFSSIIGCTPGAYRRSIKK